MKQWLKHIWEKVSLEFYTVLGCFLPIIVFSGLIYITVLFFMWLWSIEWIRTSLELGGSYICEHEKTFEYILHGTIILGLLIILCIWLYKRVEKSYEYLKRIDFFEKTKRILINVVSVIIIVLFIVMYLFLTTDGFKDCTGPQHSFENYEHRPDRY